METIEIKTAQAILQHEQMIRLDGKSFPVSAPTPATLIMASEYISQLPNYEGENLVSEVLLKAKDAKAIGYVLAILILGAKRIKQGRTIRKGLFKRVNELDWLAEYMLQELTCEQLGELLAQRLTQMQVADFFALTVSLNGVNITKATREAETACGE